MPTYRLPARRRYPMILSSGEEDGPGKYREGNWVPPSPLRSSRLVPAIPSEELVDRFG